jgi:hypothetical protein
VIRFSAALVVVAVGVLIAGIATSKLALVYVAIVLSAVALVALAIGVVLKRDELFGDAEQQIGLDAGAAAEQSALAGQPAFGHDETASGAYGSDTYGRQAGQDQSQGPARVGAAGPGSSAGGNAPGAPRRVDLTQTRTDLTQTRADMTALRDEPSRAGIGKTDLSKTRTDLTPPPASPVPSPSPAPAPAASAPPVPPVPPVPSAPSNAPAARKPAEPPSDASWFDRQRQADEAVAAESVAKSEAEGGSDADSTPAADVPSDSKDELDAKSEAKSADADTDDAVADKSNADETADDAAAPDTTIKEVAGARTAVIDTTAVNVARAGTDPSDAAEETTSTPADGEASAPSGEHQVTVVPGVPRYHAANCILIRFMDEGDLQKMTLDEANEAGCTACRACQADTGSFKASD